MPITTVAPSILTNSPTQYKEIIKKYYPFVRRAHIDISDGTLSSSVTINETAVWWPKGWSVDVENLIKLHPNLVILHAEAREDLLPIFDTLKKNGMRVGVAMVKNVYPGSIKPILAAADHAMIFSGKLGEYGGEADLLLAEKAELINDLHHGIEIGWDGGANLENIRTLSLAGIQVINVGSAIAKADDPADMFAKLNAETEKEEPL